MLSSHSQRKELFMGASFFAAIIMPFLLLFGIPYEFFLNIFGIDLISEFSEVFDMIDIWIAENPEIIDAYDKFWMDLGEIIPPIFGNL